MIKNLIIDLCGPIIKIDTGLIDARLHAMGCKVEQPYMTLYREGRVKEFDAGLIDFATFCDDASLRLGINLTPEIMEAPWNSLIVECDERNLYMLERLHHNYRLFLLSNSDCVNAAYFTEYLNACANRAGLATERNCGTDFIGKTFDEALFSWTVGLRKPDPAIFQLLMRNHGLQAEETLFVDDCAKHCASAATLGIRTLHCTTPLWQAAGEIEAQAS